VSWVQSPSLHLSTKHQAAVLGSKRKRVTGLSHPTTSLTTEFFDSYTKFFMFKAWRSKIPPYIRVFNKTGWSYGFLTDVAYIVDFKNKVEFMVSGNIYVNSDGVLKLSSGKKKHVLVRPA